MPRNRSLLPLLLFLPSLGFRDVGSAKRLEGKVETVVFFVSDPNTNWSILEKKEMLQLIYEAENWLSDQAKNYGKNLFFSHHFFGWDQDITVPIIQEGTRSGTEDVSLSTTITRLVGYDSPQQLLTQFPAENTQLLFVMKKDGASYAFAYNTGMEEQYYVEGMAIYHRFAQDIPNCVSCIAHEMLHLFGAHDYYKTFQTTAEQESEAKKRYPNSIMLRTSYDINELNIDPITRWRIGWSDYKPPMTDFFVPISYPQSTAEK